MRVVDVSGRVASHFKFKSNIVICLTKKRSLATLKTCPFQKTKEKLLNIEQLFSYINIFLTYFCSTEWAKLIFCLKFSSTIMTIYLF